MTTAETSIRESLLDILSFLASVSEQREFAAKVRYDVYQDEIACWWFDDIYPDDALMRRIFSPSQLEALVAFSEVFDRVGTSLDGKVLTMEQLQATEEWQRIVRSANEALDKIKSAA